jgi:hypothetical protein
MINAGRTEFARSLRRLLRRILAKSRCFLQGLKIRFVFLLVQPAAVRATLDAEAEKLKKTPS